ncbi:Uncharacterized protein SCF082_LOCUS26177 [Durusdinium trenchii]|uniref:Uncharacterized protein n=1 Tax=Durusdinium trenchii TaxID=1381693 RepID=A0ABP0M4W9_9DINO
MAALRANRMLPMVSAAKFWRATECKTDVEILHRKYWRHCFMADDAIMQYIIGISIAVPLCSLCAVYFGRLSCGVLRRRREKFVKRWLDDLDEQDEAAVKVAEAQLRASFALEQSLQAGIGVAYLLSEEFYQLAIWTIFEQYVAVSNAIEVKIILPRDAEADLFMTISTGAEGINAVKESLCSVDSATADAWSPDDKEAIQTKIQHGLERGFEEINEHVRQVMISWIGDVAPGHEAM